MSLPSVGNWYHLQLSMRKQLQSGLSHGEQPLSSPSAERLRTWRLYFESALALVDVLDAELEHDAGIPLRWYDALVHLEETPDGLRMNELAERILYSKSGFTRVVDRMEEAGLVRRVRPKNDRRCGERHIPRWLTLPELGVVELEQLERFFDIEQL